MTDLRIGDAEREAAASSLGEHYAAGRLTKAEYDERTAEVWKARFDADLRPLFADLPSGLPGGLPTSLRAGFPAGRPTGVPAGARVWGGRLPLFVPLFLAVMMLASIVVFSVPWLLIPLFWLAFARGHHRHRPTPAA